MKLLLKFIFGKTFNQYETKVKQLIGDMQGITSVNENNYHYATNRLGKATVLIETFRKRNDATMVFVSKLEEEIERLEKLYEIYKGISTF